ncbi:MAG: ABC transporter permease, partial [Marinoscillum sp.]
YWLQVISLGFSYSLKKRKTDASYSAYHSNNSLAMMNNYFKIALRNFQKQKLFSTINIIGLALGMSICLLALSISVAIIQSDGFHEKKDRIYQINTYFKNSQDTKTYGSTFPALGDYMEGEYPFIETGLTIHSGFQPVVNQNGNDLDFHGYFVDPEFFDVFSFDLLKGNPQTALSQPNTMVLTEAVAKKLFREVDPMGKVLKTESGDFTVTGVMPDLKQTHLYFQVLTSTYTYERNQPATSKESDWTTYKNHYLYVLLRPGTSKETLSNALTQASLKASAYHPHQIIELESVILDEAVPRWNISNALGIGLDYPSMLFFLFIGLLILLPAIFNYTNLSIARAIKRSKEIGIRKVVGAAKHQVKMQFIVETVVMMMLALAGSFVIFVYIQQEFLDVVAAAEVLETSIRPSLVIVFILFGLIIG